MSVLDPNTLFHQLKAGDRFALSRAITLVESTLDQDLPKAEQLILACTHHPVETMRIAITGAPGVGKSTFIEKLGLHLVGIGKRVAVLAIDPSSEYTQGSILGDKTRMEELSKHSKAYVRPSPNSGHHGGVNPNSYEALTLCEAAGYEVIILETVGVGQAEIQVKHLADLFVLLMQPASGDALQSIKKGILEVADLVIVHKADGKLREFAKRMRQTLQSTIATASRIKEVLLCSSIDREDHDKIWQGIHKQWKTLDISTKRIACRQFWFEEKTKSMLNRLISEKYAQDITRYKQNIKLEKMSYMDAIQHFRKKLK